MQGTNIVRYTDQMLPPCHNVRHDLGDLGRRYVLGQNGFVGAIQQIPDLQNINQIENTVQTTDSHFSAGITVLSKSNTYNKYR